MALSAQQPLPGSVRVKVTFATNRRMVTALSRSFKRFILLKSQLSFPGERSRVTFSCGHLRNLRNLCQTNAISGAFVCQRNDGFSSAMWGPSLQLGLRSGLYGLAQYSHRGSESAMKFIKRGQIGARWDSQVYYNPAAAHLPQISVPRISSPRARSAPHKHEGRRRELQSVRCIGASAGSAMATAKPFLDQILLLGTVVGVYIGGLSSAPRVPQRSSTDGRSVDTKGFKTKEAVSRISEDVIGDDWTRLQAKLTRGLSRKSIELAEEGLTQNPVLALQAIAELPRLRLLLATLQHIHKEAEGISDLNLGEDSMKWQDLALNAISRSIAPICSEWLLEEFGQTGSPPHRTQGEPAAASSQLCSGLPASPALPSCSRVGGQEGDTLIDKSTEMDVIDSMMQNFKDSESVASYIARSGKAELYADLVYFLRFKSWRIFRQYSGNVLEDMVVAIAEVVASLFLDHASSGSLNPYGDMWQTVLSPSILSSRSLERFRNEVALYGWLNENFASVTAMFEDRFDLWTVQMRRMPNSKQKQRKSQWQESALLKAGAMEVSLVLARAPLPARRGTELKALKGWKYSYSLFLEFADVMGPLLRLVVTKVGEGISFLLITLIGRSLGLVYQGIRQSVRWPSR